MTALKDFRKRPAAVSKGKHQAQKATDEGCDEPFRVLYKAPPASEQTLSSYAIACFSLAIFPTILLSVPICILFTIYKFISTISLCWGLVLLLVTLLGTFPRRIHVWPSYIHSSLWSHWRQYFSFEMLQQGELKPEQKYLFTEFPHGVFPMGQWLSQSISELIAPGNRYCKGAGADITLQLPIWRQMYGWMGVISACKPSIIEALKVYNVCIVPGGIAEMFLSTPKEERVFLKSRKGFIKLAIQQGCDLVPCYHFGNTQILSMFNPASGVLMRFSRKLRMSLIFCWGRYFLPLPRQHKIVMVIGRPMQVPHIVHPTDEQIAEVHKQFVARLQELFDANKHRVDWENKILQIH